MAATNRLTDLDPAIIRRFQKVIEVPLPTQFERAGIIKKCLNDVVNEITEDEFQCLAEATENWSGSLLFVLCLLTNRIESVQRSRDASCVRDFASSADIASDA